MTKVTVAATQYAASADRDVNIEKAEAIIHKAADQGAEIVLIQELFETFYFCKDQKQAHFALARPFEHHPMLQRMQDIARRRKLVLPISFFERANKAFFNSLAVIDADGSILGLYRKSHIPDGPGYQEKYYFNPGDTGFRVWSTRYGKIGVGICWDQWFPEAARAMALMGAEFLFYPTAIGSEPQDPSLDSRYHWQRVMQGHAAANMVPLITSNRIGIETGESCSLTFYGLSFIADHLGEKIAEADDHSETILTASFDLNRIAAERASFGFFRDRRPDLYAPLLSLDGEDRWL